MQALVGILLWDKQIKKIAKLNIKKQKAKLFFYYHYGCYYHCNFYHHYCYYIVYYVI